MQLLRTPPRSPNRPSRIWVTTAPHTIRTNIIPANLILSLWIIMRTIPSLILMELEGLGHIPPSPITPTAPHTGNMDLSGTSSCPAKKQVRRVLNSASENTNLWICICVIILLGESIEWGSFSGAWKFMEHQVCSMSWYTLYYLARNYCWTNQSWTISYLCWCDICTFWRIQESLDVYLLCPLIPPVLDLEDMLLVDVWATSEQIPCPTNKSILQ